MKHTNILAIALSATSCLGYKRFDGEQVFRITDRSFDIQNLETILGDDVDVWSYKRGALDVRVSKEKLTVFKNWMNVQNVEHELFIENVQDLIDDRQARKVEKIEDINDFNYSTYHTFEEIHDWTREICRAYQDVCKIINFGKTYEGRDMIGMHLSAHPEGRHEHAFLMMAGIHAREWIAPASTMAITERLLRNFREGHKQERDILHNMDWYVLPLVNVDGYAYTFSDDRMWRKTRTPNVNSTCIGKDPNRNWATEKWDDDVGSSGKPCSSTYRGEHPMSEPCVHNVGEFVRQTHQIHPIKAMLDIHSYSQLWLYPHGYTAEPTHNAGYQATIGKFATGAIYDVYGSEFGYGSCYEVIYPATGITVDWMHDTAKVPCAVTPELRDTGRYGFLLPEDQILPVAEEMYPGYMLMAHGVIEGYCERD